MLAHVPLLAVVLSAATGALAQDSNLVAFNSLAGSRTSVIVDETPNGKYLFPPSRGASNLVSKIGPCQGYELAGRAEYPVSGGTLSWNAIVDLDDITFAYSTAADPTAQSDFVDVITNVTRSWRGQQCVAGPDFSALGLEAGANVTVQFRYASGGGGSSSTHYECADLTLVTPAQFTAGNYDEQCTNSPTTTKQRRDSVSNPQIVDLRASAEASALAEAEASEGSEGISKPVCGVIGAMVTLGAVVLVFLAAWAGKFVHFGRQPRLTRHESGSSGSSIPQKA